MGDRGAPFHRETSMGRTRIHHAFSLFFCVAGVGSALACGDTSLPAAGTRSEETARGSQALENREELAVLRSIEDHRPLGDARLRDAIHSPVAVVAETALVAAGRIGDTSLVD